LRSTMVTAAWTWGPHGVTMPLMRKLEDQVDGFSGNELDSVHVEIRV
jgi:hypothetical protein